MSERYEICSSCRDGDCEFCDDSWEGTNGDEHYCICDCTRGIDDIIGHNDDIWNKYRDLYDEDEDY